MFIILVILAGVLGWIGGVHLPWYVIIGVIILHCYLVITNKYGEGLAGIPMMTAGFLSCGIMILSGLINSDIDSYSGFIDSLKFIFTGG